MSLSSLVFMHLTSPMEVLDRYQLISVIVSRLSASERESPGAPNENILTLFKAFKVTVFTVILPLRQNTSYQYGSG